MEGAKQARELREAYFKLEELLSSRFEGLNGQRLRVLAEDTYREGVAILRGALDTFRGLQQVDYQLLWHEIGEWSQQLEQLEQLGAATGDPRAETLATRIASHRRRLELYKERAESFDRMLAQSEELEAALESTYLETIALKSADILLARGDSVAALERAVSAARRVEDRLRGQEAPDRDDDVYLEAGEG